MKRSLVAVISGIVLAGAVFAEETPAPPTFTAGKDGFALRSMDGAFVLRLRGYLQLDARIFDGSGASDTFVVRRARPILEATVFRVFDLRLMPDFGAGTTVLQDGYVEARFLPAVRLRAGKFKPPVGLERLQSATDLVFVERAMPTNLVPNRDVGAQLAGDLAKSRVQYAVGFFNGVPDGGSGDSDNDDAKDVAARVFVQPFAGGGRALPDLGVGVAFSTGDQAGTVSAPNLPTFRTAGQVSFFSYRSDGTAAGTVIPSGKRTRIAPQATFYRGPFGLMAEYVQSKQKVRRGSDEADITNSSWQTAVSWVIRGTASYRGVNPESPFSGLGTGPGAWELATRYSELDVDDDAFPTFANPSTAARKARAVGVGVNWWASRNVRFLLSGERTKFDGGAADGDRREEKVLMTRFQISF
jgi:phosphate-selective porin OprO and OprP